MSKAAASYIVANHKTMTLRAMAADLGVGQSTVYRWKDDLRAQKRIRHASVSDETIEEWRADWEAHRRRQQLMGVPEEEIGEWCDLNDKLLVPARTR